MKIFKLFVLILLAACTLTLSSCDEDDNKPSGEFENGIFVINEGNYLDADGSVSFINQSDGAVHQNLFGSVNSGLALGDVVQSMTIEDDLSYIVVNNSNKIEVVNANTFEKQYTIDGLSLPRYFVTHDGKGYVTEWVSFTDPGRVTIIDLENHTAGQSITTDYGAENILAHEGLLYVSNSFTSSVSVIDPDKNEVIKTIQVGNSPGALLVDHDNFIWVMCGGGYDLDFNALNDGTLVRLDPAKSENESANSILSTIELGMNLTAKGAMNKSGDKIFFYKGTSVYGVSTSALTGPSAALITDGNAVNFYGIGIDPETDLIYLGDSKNFVGDGTVYRYTTSGQFVDSKPAGRGPNGFVFK